MYIDKDSRGQYSINELSEVDITTIKYALAQCLRQKNEPSVELMYKRIRDQFESYKRRECNETKE